MTKNQWIILVVVVVVIIAIIVIRNSVKGSNPSNNPITNVINKIPPIIPKSTTNNNTNTTPTTINPVGKIALAKSSGVSVYMLNPFTFYKTAAKDEYIGTVIGYFDQDNYYKIENVDDSTRPKIVFVSQSYLTT